MRGSEPPQALPDSGGEEVLECCVEGQIDLGSGLVDASCQEAHCGAAVGRGRWQRMLKNSSHTRVPRGRENKHREQRPAALLELSPAG